MPTENFECTLDNEHRQTFGIGTLATCHPIIQKLYALTREMTHLRDPSKEDPTHLKQADKLKNQAFTSALRL